MISNVERKGVILAGGTGTRLFPITKGISKHLLPVYDKPMIYYSLSVLMLAGIKDIYLISKPEDKANFYSILGDGKQLGIKINYLTQSEPKGIADALLITEPFLRNNPIALVLGDNLFYGHGLIEKLKVANSRQTGATIFAHYVKKPEKFGVVEFDTNFKIRSLVEKPKKPRSNYAVTGLYFYDESVFDKALELQPSDRGELEITDVNCKYLESRSLELELLGRGFAWLDTGTHDSLLEAGQYIQTIEHRQGLKVACLEEISFRNGWIDVTQLKALAAAMVGTEYSNYLYELAEINSPKLNYDD